MSRLLACLSIALGAVPVLTVDNAHRFSPRPAQRSNAVVLVRPGGGGIFVVKWPDPKRRARLDAEQLVSVLDDRRFPGFAAGDHRLITLGHVAPGKKFSYDLHWPARSS
jgi:hypothetical protein